MPNTNEAPSLIKKRFTASSFLLPTFRLIKRYTKFASLTTSLFAFVILADVAYAQEQIVV